MIKYLVFAYVVIGALYFCTNVCAFYWSAYRNSVLDIMPNPVFDGDSAKDVREDIEEMFGHNDAKIAMFLFGVSFIGGAIWPIAIYSIVKAVVKK